MKHFKLNLLTVSHFIGTCIEIILVKSTFLKREFQIYFQEFNFRSIRVNTPVLLVVNGRKLGRDKQAATVLSVSALSD